MGVFSKILLLHGLHGSLRTILIVFKMLFLVGCGVYNIKCIQLTDLLFQFQALSRYESQYKVVWRYS